jgi:hypothetical protein
MVNLEQEKEVTGCPEESNSWTSRCLVMRVNGLVVNLS